MSARAHLGGKDKGVHTKPSPHVPTIAESTERVTKVFVPACRIGRVNCAKHHHAQRNSRVSAALEGGFVWNHSCVNATQVLLDKRVNF